ncbi:MAG: rhomboid family intramembrane serine protease [Phocaeicola sp.]
MGNFVTDLKQKFELGDISIRFIFVNVGIFLLSSLILVGFRLFNHDASYLLHNLELPASIKNYIWQPWTLLTYMFMHAGVLHLLFNMLWLYWFGQLFLYQLSAKHFRGLYILGGIFGGLFYMIAYNVFPYFASSLPSSYLLGASASVLAIVVATAVRMPEQQIQFMFIGGVRLKYVALFVVISDLLFITSGNAGGHIAHLGGALGGWLFSSSLRKGTDLTAWINRIWDLTISFFTPSAKPKKAKMNVHYSEKRSDYDYNSRKKQQSEEVDRILDKLKKSGYASLSSEEKKRLFDASKK